MFVSKQLVDEDGAGPDEATTVRYKREIKKTAAVRTSTSADGSSRTVADLVSDLADFSLMRVGFAQSWLQVD